MRCGLLSGTDQLQYKSVTIVCRRSCGLLSGTDQLQFVIDSLTHCWVVACSQARISYNNAKIQERMCNVVACSQARISYNRNHFSHDQVHVVACSQARISYNHACDKID